MTSVKAFGYARASSTDRDCKIQLAQLEAYGCEFVLSEFETGPREDGTSKRSALITLLRPGDTLVVSRLDRLAFTLDDLASVVKFVEARGCFIKCIEQPIDTSSQGGANFGEFLTAVTEFAAAKSDELQIAYLEFPKTIERHKKAKSSAQVDAVKALAAKGMGAMEIARSLGVTRAIVFAALVEDALG